MDFITIDFETATSERNSPCEIGLTFVKDNRIVETKSWLIKPIGGRFDYFNMLIHGIQPKDVADKPEFDELWSEVGPLIEHQFLIAHNASFDFSVLRKTLDTYGIPYPSLHYSCSYILSKKVWTNMPAYDLKTLCNYNNICFKHHRAGADSEATAELVLKAFELVGIRSMDDFPTKLSTSVGQLFCGGYQPCRTKKVHPVKLVPKIVGDPLKHRKDSPFYGKTLVLAGALSRLTRMQAHQRIADLGGIPKTSVTKMTDYLVVTNDFGGLLSNARRSSQHEKAIRLIENGATIKIISEAELVRML